MLEPPKSYKFHLLHQKQTRPLIINKKRLQTKTINSSNHSSNRKRIENQEITPIVKACEYSDSLKELHLNWDDSSKINDKSLDLLGETLKNTPSLQVLDLFFFRCRGITANGFMKLSQGLKQLKQLKKIKIVCRLFHLDDNIIVNLGKTFKRMISLREIDLGFGNGSRIGDIGLEALKKGLRNCKLLKKLRISLSGCKSLTENGLDSLSEAIGKLVSLESISLHMYIEADEHGKKGGLRSLSTSLGKLGFLRDIRLSFPVLTNINDDDLSSLMGSIKRLKFINHINLQFGACAGITDVGFKEVCEGLSELERLEDLHLSLYYCKNITDQGLCAFGKVLGRMSSLEKFRLSLNCAVLVTDAGLKAIKEGLEENDKVQSLWIEIASPPESARAMLQRFEEELKKIANIKKLIFSIDIVVY